MWHVFRLYKYIGYMSKLKGLSCTKRYPGGVTQRPNSLRKLHNPFTFLTSPKTRDEEESGWCSMML
jgi:hypothetical protein